MALTYSTATKTARMSAVKDQIDLGSGAGKLEIGTTAMASVLVTVTLNDPCGSASAAALAFAGFPKTVAASLGGTAATARIRDSDNNDVITGLTVGTSNADIILDNTSINAAQNVTINATPTITHS